jgi:integrase
MIYKSILKNEMTSFMEFLKLSITIGKTYQSYKNTLLELDSFLCKTNLTEKKLESEPLALWLDEMNTSISTKKGKLSRVKRFSVYLSTLEIPVRLPELPKKTTDFMPYVFSEDEMTRIFELADDFIITNSNSRIAAEFPMLLRILYGCGLRLGEAVSLTWKDVDLDSGIITIKANKAKNQKERLVPMIGELTRILILYRNSTLFKKQDNGFLFRNEKGNARTNGSYWGTFNKILCELGIKNPQTQKYGARGPCIHSLRHTFTLHSLLKAESEGRGRVLLFKGISAER